MIFLFTPMRSNCSNHRSEESTGKTMAKGSLFANRPNPRNSEASADVFAWEPV